MDNINAEERVNPVIEAVLDFVIILIHFGVIIAASIFLGILAFRSELLFLIPRPLLIDILFVILPIIAMVKSFCCLWAIQKEINARRHL